MDARIKIITSITVTAFLAAAAVLVSNVIFLSYLIDTNRITNKIDAVMILVFSGFLVALVFMAASLPFTLRTTKQLLSPISKKQDKSQYDTLTGVYNRRYVDENLKNLINFMSRSGGKLTLMVISIDFFKIFNQQPLVDNVRGGCDI